MFWSEQDSKSERIIAQRPRRSRILDGASYLQRKCRGNFEHQDLVLHVGRLEAKGLDYSPSSSSISSSGARNL